MFLMFHLERPDVLAVGDLGIRRAIERAYGLDALPQAAEIERIAEPWRPAPDAGLPLPVALAAERAFFFFSFFFFAGAFFVAGLLLGVACFCFFFFWGLRGFLGGRVWGPPFTPGGFCVSETARSVR